MIQKTICMLLVLAMMLSLAACAAGNDPQPTADAVATPAETESPTVPAETVPETTAVTEATLPPLDLSAFELTDMEKMELERACSLGFPLEKLGQETIRAVEYVHLMDHLVEIADGQKLEQWKEMFPALRRSTSVLNRFEAMMIAYLAADFLGEEYSTINMSANEAMDQSKQYKMNWNVGYVRDWDLYGGGDAMHERDSYVLGEGMVFDRVEAACYYFNIAKVSYTSFESMFSFDQDSASMRPGDDCTYAEALLALVRLYDSRYENVYGE